MKASIVIPAFNEESHIANAIDAAMNQTYPGVEIIVVDNASTDRTAEIARRYPIIVVSESKKGTSAARECGRRHATGEIIAFMDADCLPKPTWLSTGINIFSDKRVVGASGPYLYYDAGFIFKNMSWLFQHVVYKVVNSIMQIVHNGGTMIGGNSFFRASAIDSVGGFNTDVVFYGDEIEMSRRIAKVGRIVFSNLLTMKTSSRRFRTEGFVKITWKYLYHFFKGPPTKK